MQRVRRMLLLAGIAGAALPATESIAAAEATEPVAPAPSPVSVAEDWAAKAFEAYSRKDYASAVELYQRALEAAPSADIVYNLARVYDIGLRDAALARRYYERYLEETGAVPSRIDIAKERIAALRAAEEARARRSPKPDPVLAAEVSADGAEQGSGWTPALAIAAGSAGLVGLGIGAGFGIAAQHQLDESRRSCDGNRCTSQRGVDAARAANRSANIATLGFGVGGSLLALGTVLWLVSDREPEQPEPAPRLQLTPTITSKELSLALSGSFGGP